MKFESKFTVGETVYFVENDRIRRGQISDVEMRSGGNFKYAVRDIWPSGKLGRQRIVEESNLFKSPQECADHLVKNVVMSPAA